MKFLRRVVCWINGHDSTRELWTDHDEKVVALVCDFCGTQSFVDEAMWRLSPERYSSLWLGVLRDLRRADDGRFERAIDRHRMT